MSKNIITLANDLAQNKVTDYSVEDSNEVLRNALLDVLGLDKYSQTGVRKAIRRNKVKIFEIIEETLDLNIDDNLSNQFEDWVEYRNIARGDKQAFYMPDDQVFKVALIADGTQNLKRQRIRGGQSISVGTKNYGVKIYEELDRFLAGLVDWNAMIQNVARSFAIQIRDEVMNAIIDNFSEVGAEYQETYAGADASEAELLALAQKVSARTRQEVAIYGTKLALHKVKPDVASDAQRGERNATGYYDQIAGINMYELEQTINSDGEFELRDDFLLILPVVRDRMVKVVNEGESFVNETAPEDNASLDLEYTMTNRMGIAIIPSSVYGYVSIS